MSNNRVGRRRALLLAPLLMLAVAPFLAHSVAADTQPPSPINSAAAALAPAVRLGVVTTTTAVPPPTPPLPPGGIVFPMNPLPRCDILDNFGDGRSGGRTHLGDDILATLGQEVYAVVDGTLVHQLVDGQPGAELSGNYWVLRADADRSLYVFGHLSAFAPGLVVGSHVTSGQLIGYVGDTGNPGPGNYHLHFGYQPQGGAYIDPLPLLRSVMPASCKVF
jgi:murein DD-endopeptidase MepM/ murein hydrolase activator NlpD